MKLNKSVDEIFIFYDPLLVTASLSDVSANLSQSRQHFLVAFSINRAPRQYLSSCTNIVMITLVELNLVVPQGGDIMEAITATITKEHPGVMSAATWKKLHL